MTDTARTKRINQVRKGWRDMNNVKETKERPIIFNSEMIRAILEGRKTQTRRIVKSQPPKGSWVCFDGIDAYQGEGYFFQYPQNIDGGKIIFNKKFLLPQKGKCPFGKIGDRLWVRETWAVIDYPDGTTARKYETIYKANDNSGYPYQIKWKPLIFMPRNYSRITLEITDIRVERLHEITREDITKEGFGKGYTDIGWTYVFGQYWNLIHKEGHKWKDNPWVWVIGFKRLERS